MFLSASHGHVKESIRATGWATISLLAVGYMIDTARTCGCDEAQPTLFGPRLYLSRHAGLNEEDNLGTLLPQNSIHVAAPDSSIPGLALSLQQVVSEQLAQILLYAMEKYVTMLGSYRVRVPRVSMYSSAWRGY